MVAQSGSDPSRYLGADSVIDGDHPEVVVLARRLRQLHFIDVPFAREAYHWVRDRINHAGDIGSKQITLSASEVLRERVGWCYAKSHLLAAILRSQNIPAGLCYQRLRKPDGHFVLHGLIAVYLNGAWHRQDPRGNRPGLNAEFSLDGERLAWPIDTRSGECDFPGIYVTAVPSVVAALGKDARESPFILPSGL
jgi:transglutaminase-like putative cysteine protease